MLHEVLPPWAKQPPLPLTPDDLELIRDHAMSRYMFFANAHNEFKQYLTCKTGKLYLRFVLACKLESAAVLRLDDKMFAAATKKQEEMLAQIFGCLEEDKYSVLLKENKEDKEAHEFIFPSEILVCKKKKRVYIPGGQIFDYFASTGSGDDDMVVTPGLWFFDSLDKGDQSMFLAGEICKTHRVRIEKVTKSLQLLQYWKYADCKTGGKIVDNNGVIVAN